MIRLDLNQVERNILTDILEGDLSDLRMEISDTDLKDFRDKLKKRKEVILKVLEALK